MDDTSADLCDVTPRQWGAPAVGPATAAPTEGLIAARSRHAMLNTQRPPLWRAVGCSRPRRPRWRLRRWRPRQLPPQRRRLQTWAAGCTSSPSSPLPRRLRPRPPRPRPRTWDPKSPPTERTCWCAPPGMHWRPSTSPRPHACTRTIGRPMRQRPRAHAPAPRARPHPTRARAGHHDPGRHQPGERVQEPAAGAAQGCRHRGRGRQQGAAPIQTHMCGRALARTCPCSQGAGGGEHIVRARTQPENPRRPLDLTHHPPSPLPPPFRCCSTIRRPQPTPAPASARCR